MVGASAVTLSIGVVHGAMGYFYIYKDTPRNGVPGTRGGYLLSEYLSNSHECVTMRRSRSGGA